MTTGIFRIASCRYLQTTLMTGKAPHSRNEYNIIMKHLWSKINLNPKEWKKIYKGLHALDFLVKNGAPRIVQDLKDDLYKIRTLQDMQYTVDGVDKTAGI